MSNPIGWCTDTLNVVVGCSQVSAGCDNCYAKTMLHRFPELSGIGYGSGDGMGIGWDNQAHFKSERLEKPFHWKKPRRIFIASMGDLWHPSVTREQRAAIFGVICSTPHIYLDLTKRPENRLEWFSEERTTDQWAEWLRLHMHDNGIIRPIPSSFSWPPPNYWCGVSVEDQKTADERIPLLLQTPAAKRFVSYEPALERAVFDCHLPKLDLVIMGAETGPRKRPMDLEWACSMRDRCAGMRTPFWFKKDSQGNETLDGEIHHPEFWR